MPDLTGIIVGLSRIQSDLRYLDMHPEQYPADGHLEKLINLTTVMQGEVMHWMRRGDSEERRQERRRQGEDRRRTEERRHAERRTEADPA